MANVSNKLVQEIVNDYMEYLNSNTVGVELESLIEYHIHKNLGNPPEEDIKAIMTTVINRVRKIVKS